MRFRDRVALNLCPLLARLVLAATFIWVGFGELKPTEFTGRDAAVLQSLDIGTNPQAVGDPDTTPDDAPQLPESNEEEDDGHSTAIPRGHFMDSLWAGGFATFDQDEAGDESTDTNAESDSPLIDETDSATTEPAALVIDPDLTIKARAFRAKAIQLYDAGHPSPGLMSVMLVILEIASGLLILVGLLTRIWGAALVVAIGYAMYLTTIQSLLAVAPGNATGIASMWTCLRSFGQLGSDTQTLAFSQLAQFALACIVMLMGAGRLSVDGLLFGAIRTAAREDSATQPEDD